MANDGVRRSGGAFDRRTPLQFAASVPSLIARSAHAQSRPPGTQPNFIHICADDMRSDDDKYMSNLRRLIRAESTVFGNHFVPFPSCGPSRASMLTGRQPHNHGILGNHKPYGYFGFRSIEGNALAPWLANAGYTVSHVGKFINGYPVSGGLHIPPGYADWHVFGPNSDPYYNFSLNENGTYVRYDSGEYSTEVFVEKVLNFIAVAPQPFAVFLWVTCPHLPSIPAAGDLGTFDGVAMPVADSFNEFDMSDKPKPMHRLRLLTDKQIAAIRRHWRRRQETLQALDRGIASIVDALMASGRIDNTHIIFTSDNGYLEGEHRVNDRKDLLYDEGASVPLYWRQPGGQKGVVMAPVLSIDATAAMLELAGALPGIPLDGRSLVPLLSGNVDGWNTAALIECHKSVGVVTQHYLYVEWFHGDGIELYDMVRDPAQMQNVAGDPAYAEVQASLAATLQVLRNCAGSSCSWTTKIPSV
jgi:arylsulfatase A-like enzyme